MRGSAGQEEKEEREMCSSSKWLNYKYVALLHQGKEFTCTFITWSLQHHFEITHDVDTTELQCQGEREKKKTLQRTEQNAT